MIIYNHDHKDRVVLELEENELTLIAHLVEKSHQNLQGKMKESLSSKLHAGLQEFINN